MNNEQMTNEQRPTLIVDADDTLWETEIHYQQCITDFAALLEVHGFERDEAKEMLEVVERERVPGVGYTPDAFIRSLVITHRRLCKRYGQLVAEEVSDAVWALRRTVIHYRNRGA